MSIDSITAAQFYNAAKPATKPDADGSPASDAFSNIAASFVETLQAGEAVSKAALTGNADTPSLVMALAKSELAVETAVTVRDKVVEAYQEILRMPV
jgi:flagellar hook-basal body complex protein FliE